MILPASNSPAAAADPLESSQYRGISGLAVASLLLGVASFLAAFSSLLLVIPLFTIAASIIALRSIAANRAILSGSGFALAGLFLAVFWTAFVPARVVMRRQHLVRHAQTMGDSFFQFLREGQIAQAHQLHTRKTAAAPPIESPHSHDEPAPPSAYELFLKNETVKKLQAEYAGESEARLEHAQLGLPLANGESIYLKYEVRRTKKGADAKPIPVWLVITRTFDEIDHSLQWKLVQILSTEPSRSES